MKYITAVNAPTSKTASLQQSNRLAPDSTAGSSPLGIFCAGPIQSMLLRSRKRLRIRAMLRQGQLKNHAKLQNTLKYRLASKEFFSKPLSPPSLSGIGLGEPLPSSAHTL
jgi:hypothetical protein